MSNIIQAPLQINALAQRIEKFIPGFANPVYPGWDSLFRSLNTSLRRRITLCLDEFPYLVKNSPELPSILQNIHDDGAHSNFNIILCGSSQMMMNGLVLDSHAPLYGRADEIMKIQPMSATHLRRFLGLSAIETVSEYGIWGGVPRYWEIRKASGSLDVALREHLVNQYGLLTDEPERLFSDEIRTSVQAFTLLSLIGSGCHRLSELAARTGKPSTHLSRALAFLTELQYIRREIPFGESSRSTKRSLYKIHDPFLNFYFTFIVPDKSRIDLGLSSHNPASRWWGKGIDGVPFEIDVVSESTGKKSLLVGEAKWTENKDVTRVADELIRKSANLPIVYNHKILLVLFVKHKPAVTPPGILIFGPEEVMEGLR